MTLQRLERRGDLAVLRLDKARGNSIDEALVLEMLEACRQLATEEGVRGVLLASAHPKLFCPGLDLVGLWEYDRPAMDRFFSRFAQALWALYALPKPVVAALSGHAVAGGCLLALTADERVLRQGPVQIGLNEVRIGVPLPWSATVLLRATVRAEALARVALLGRNFTGEEALAAGLVDAVVPGEGFEESCLARLQEYAEKDAFALARTKVYLRAPILDQMKAREAELRREFLDAWFSPATRERIRQIIASLSKSEG